MMKDAWDDYVRWAWGNNELKPVSQSGQTGGIFGTAEIGATIVDSLDTLFIMELMDEYEIAKEFVVKDLKFVGVVS
jgi:mannosyl-oligosaccharide alpha-1,2-mannosidase